MRLEIKQNQMIILNYDIYLGDFVSRTDIRFKDNFPPFNDHDVFRLVIITIGTPIGPHHHSPILKFR